MPKQRCLKREWACESPFSPLTDRNAFSLAVMNEPMCIWRILLPRPLWQPCWTSWGRTIQTRLPHFRFVLFHNVSPNVLNVFYGPANTHAGSCSVTSHTGRSIFFRGHERGQADKHSGSGRVSPLIIGDMRSNVANLLTYKGLQSWEWQVFVFSVVFKAETISWINCDKSPTNLVIN